LKSGLRVLNHVNGHDASARGVHCRMGGGKRILQGRRNRKAEYRSKTTGKQVNRLEGAEDDKILEIVTKKGRNNVQRVGGPVIEKT